MNPSVLRYRTGGLGLRALPLVVALVVACGGSPDQADGTGAHPASTAATTTVPSTTTSAPTTVTTQATTTSSTPAVDAVAAVQDGLAAAGSSYRFTSVVVIGDEVNTTITGVVDGTSFSSTIVTADAVVDYIKTGEGEWVRGADQQWVVLDEPSPAGDPLASLREPLAAEVVRADGSILEIVATYPGPVLGSDAAEAPVTLVIDNGVVRAIRYDVMVGGSPTRVDTELSDFGAVEPITAPEV